MFADLSSKVGILFNWFWSTIMVNASSFDSGAQDKVQRNLNRLTALVKGKVSMTERELALLAVAVTEMLAAGLDPYSEHFVIEVALCLQFLFVIQTFGDRNLLAPSLLTAGFKSILCG